MSASPLMEMSAKTKIPIRDVEQKDSADSEKSFDQVLKQKTNSRSANIPQILSQEKNSSENEASNIDSEDDNKDSFSKIKKETNESVAGRDAKKDSKVKKFMDSFESEFQVPPTRLVEVISQLTPEQLSESAEQTADSVIDQLNLDPLAKPKAKKQYLELIQDLNQISVANQQLTPLPGLSLMGLGMAQERFQKMKSQREVLQKSIDQMNQSFWKPREVFKDNTLVELSKSDILSGSESAVPTKMSRLVEPDFNNQLMNLTDSNSQLDSELSNQVLTTKFDGQTELPTIDLLHPSKAATVENITTVPNIPTVLTVPAVATPGMAEAEVIAATAGIAETAARATATANTSAVTADEWRREDPKIQQRDSELLNTDQMNSSLLKKTEAPERFKEGQSATSYFEGQAQGKELSKTQRSNKSKGEELKSLFAAQLGNQIYTEESARGEATSAKLIPKELTPAEIDKNIQNVMHQAQYLVKKGGGEVNVKMSPEGLGQIQLKVELIDGKVQMQMVTDNKETKKILESNMGDLKDQLSSHKLNINSIKIDTVQGVNTDVATRNQNSLDLSQNQSDRQTKQFWNQFQDQFGRGPQREALFQPPQVKGYAKKSSQPIAPAESSQLLSARRETGKGSGLNLVA